MRQVPLFLASLIAITSCGGGAKVTPTSSYTITVSPQPASIPVNSQVTFTATTDPPGGQVFWGIVDQGVGVNLGSPTVQVGGTFTYTAPPIPPASDDFGVNPGSVAVRASVPTPGSSMTQFNVVITAPNITTGFFPISSNTVALGKTLGISAYAVGSVNGAITMQVNGTTGGSATYGTITPLPNAVYFGEYTYTAPSTMPMAGNTVTVTAISQADPTKSTSMTLTLTTS
jgi:hypothetical protein